MPYDTEKYFTRDADTGRVYQWTNAAIDRHIADQLGDMSELVLAVQLLQRNGMNGEEAVEVICEGIFAKYDSDVYEAAEAILTDALSVKAEAA